ncbi:hypothetical protein GUITHDRAFT_118033 [Guillardia theta CCMP2712]|uniref:monogalactosyldiacylglycerol synthase n=2 Tax=Guillardia theta TaxID=55529 RepID=L1IHP1_GUITC|nr:hypothetical protein GUITHDRAFT_118033 [Guillardia theta CCMP2712]EKX35758.1 hypothetical protein GUITHDRAFT_118033 [Guillardia theta CCMP2712]|eukprot:XP_005822738.1 hypothetical protein GUITHDRAFT_118033 [Guillardia theta CCMP2712]
MAVKLAVRDGKEGKDKVGAIMDGRGCEEEEEGASGGGSFYSLAWALSHRLAQRFWERRWRGRSYGEATRVLILMSETGGGHKASAWSIAEALEAQADHPLQISIVDMFVRHTNFPFNRLPKMYSYLSNKPRMWEAVYKTTKMTAGTILGCQEALSLAWIDHFHRCVEEEDPDLIISVHPLVQDGVARVVRRIRSWRNGRDIAFVTVVTDLVDIHPFWFHPAVDRCFVPTEGAREVGGKCGIASSRLAVCGLPVRKGFLDILGRRREEVRAGLALEDLQTVLVLGGGDGVGDLGTLARAVGGSMRGSMRRQLIIVCGKNTRVFEELQEEKWPREIRVFVLGYVTNMFEWMFSSDVVVTKAGPGTIAEACICGLPIMISGFLPGQEEGNVDYIESRNIGEYHPDVSNLAERLKAWLADSSLLERMSRNARAASYPRASLEIAGEILEIVQGRREAQKNIER